MIPFIKQAYEEGHRLYQDNDPKHTSRYIQGFFEENGINWWKRLAESPDINCIENVWAALKCFGMTPEVCARYIGHLDKVLPAVVEAKGGPSGHNF